MKKQLISAIIFLCLSAAILLPALAFAPDGQSSVPDLSADDWQPLYTGENKDWQHAAPWAAKPGDGESHSSDQDPGINAAADIDIWARSRDDYCGCYINCSGTLTVLVKSPSEKTAAEYAARSDTGFWIAEAQYTLNQLSRAQQLFEEILVWAEANPAENIRPDSCQLSQTNNKVFFGFSAPSLDPLYEAFDLPDCVEVLWTEIAPSAQNAEIPREPVTQWSTLDGAITATMAQAEYPVGTSSVTVILENRSDGTALYGEMYSMEKYVDGQWTDAGSPRAFNLIGWMLAEHDQSEFKIDTASYPAPLGEGLYRITGSDLHYAPKGGGTGYGAYHVTAEKYVVEFVITEDAAQPAEDEEKPLTPYEEEKATLSRSGLLHADYSLSWRYKALIYSSDNGNALCIQVFDRDTGKSLMQEPVSLDTEFNIENILLTREDELLIRTPETVFRLWMDNGEVCTETGALWPDEDIPFEPVSSAQAFGADISVAMERSRYNVGTDTVAVLVTNNTNCTLSFSYSLPRYNLLKTENTWSTNCWYRPADESTALDRLTVPPVEDSLAPGETRRVEIDLREWKYDNGSGSGEAAPLGRGLYELICSDREITFTAPDGTQSVSRVAFLVEFVLE